MGEDDAKKETTDNTTSSVKLDTQREETNIMYKTSTKSRKEQTVRK